MYGDIVFAGFGHGGKDPGAVANNIQEKDLNLARGLILKKRLEQHGLKVKCPRTKDIYISLTGRAEFANNLCTDTNQLYLSFHHNKFNGKAKGSETYRSIFNKEGSKTYKFCDKLLSEMVNIGFKNRGNQTRESEKYPGTDYYTIIKKTKMKCIIFEPYFIDNDADVELGKKKEDDIIEAIVKAVCWYYGKTYKPLVTKHWADDSYDYLKSNGVGISSKLYDIPLYRANGFSMLADLMQELKKEISVLRKEINNLKKQE